ncbi:hypothetical protein [Peptostreptococcus anaerobius]|uniref:Uncharacterized protein n=1 Tax=Peptostreptococcus anaerobius TaxID=1261 RepID=A0A135YZ07_9FIRM|nr:hypothetical protein [Peptostreptococcus anaerobius]KXI14625.1 hypothetical protein HMPREF3195_00146 [Peptostreptococcus anaerobius]
MNLVIYTDDEIIFNPDTIYRDGKTIKAKKFWTTIIYANLKMMI